MEPTEKAKGIDDLLQTLTPGGERRTDAIRMNRCIWCKKEVEIKDFKDLLSVKEYRISGFCQKCQDETFC